MKIPNGALVQVDGWVMLQGLPEGRYRVYYDAYKDRNDRIQVRKIYCFYRPRGKKCLVRHYMDNVDIMVKPADSSDFNKIVIL